MFLCARLIPIPHSIFAGFGSLPVAKMGFTLEDKARKNLATALAVSRL
jgi:hypothetical protein